MKAVIAFFLTCSVGFVQAQKNPFNQFKIDYWSTKEGLPSDLLLNLYQSHNGFLWISSNSGLTRFDGLNFVTFNSRAVPAMKTDVVGKVIEGDDSTLWIPTQNSGLIGHKDGKFTPYLNEFNRVRIVAQSNTNRLLLLDAELIGKSLYHFLLFDTHTKKYTQLNDFQVKGLFEEGKVSIKNRLDNAGNQWRRIGNKIERIQSGESYALTQKEGIIADIYYDELYVDKTNRIWLTSKKGLFLWNGKSMKVFPGMENKSFSQAGNNNSGLILGDQQGGVWVATNEGLAYLAPNEKEFAFAPQTHPIYGLNISNIIQDQEGNIWISTETGLYKLSYSKFINYSAQDGLKSGYVNGVCVLDNNRYLVSDRKGKLYKIENGIVLPFTNKNKEFTSISNDIIHLYKDSAGNKWICGNNMLYKATKDDVKLVSAGSAVRFAYEDKDKKMWFGLPFKGIAFLNKKDTLELLNFPKIDFKPLYISTIRKLINGNWLITTYNKGIVFIDKQGEATYLDTFASSTFAVFDAFEDPDGTLWLPSSVGLFRYKQGILANIDAKDGLPENALFAFLPDKKGYVWFSTGKGLVRAKKQELTDYLDKKTATIHWQLYDSADGMLGQACVGSRHSAISPDGHLLVPTYRSLVEIDPTKLITNKIPPPVVIHRVLWDNTVIDLNERNQFQPGNHRYIFEYSALSFVAPEKVKFKFRMKGYDRAWITATGDRKAYYTNIPYGNYTFQVIACNNDGVWNETGASFNFTIEPYFYETTWFRLLMALLLVFFIWIIIRWRTKVTRKENEILESQIAIRTEDLKKTNNELNRSNLEIATQRDVLEKTLTELKSTQAQLIQKEKMASLGELTAGVAHEIQNPLNFVNNFSEVSAELITDLQEELHKPNRDTELEAEILGDLKQNLQKITHHGGRASAIVKGMLEHSRTSTGEKRPTDLNTLVDEYLKIAYQGIRAKNDNFIVQFITDFDPAVGQFELVPQEIGRVLLNLFNNAFYAIRERQKQSQADYQPMVTVNTARIASGIELRVGDNGMGIQEAVKQKIFQPFFTTKPTGEGTGLGLSLAYDIVTKGHGGTISMESQEGQGTQFVIQLPDLT